MLGNSLPQSSSSYTDGENYIGATQMGIAQIVDFSNDTVL